MERFGAQIVSFIVSVILARILSPSVYGEISLVIILANILQVFVDSGFGNALIQKKDADSIDFSTVFYFNLVSCIILYLFLFSFAPTIASFYDIPSLTSPIRVVGLIIIISGIKNIQQAYVSRHMLFKKFFFSTLIGTIIAATIAIVMAYQGYGIWSLVELYVVNPLIDTIILWMTVKWRPRELFSFSRLKILFSFGWKILVTSILTELFNDLRALVIGKVYTTEDLAYYNNGNKIPQLFTNNIDSTIRSVLFPALSSEQDNKELLKAHMLKSIKVANYIMLPILLGMAASANQIILVIWTEKWIQSVPYFQIMCIVLAMNSIQATNQQAILAQGHSDSVLIVECLIKCVGVISLLLSVKWGVMAIALSTLFTAVIALFINLWPNRSLLNCSIKKQIWNITPEIGLSVVMCLFVFFVGRLINSAPFVVLIVQVLIGVGVYLFGSKIFKMSSYQFMLGLMKGAITGSRKEEEQ